jgi:hypothetical protein
MTHRERRARESFCAAWGRYIGWEPPVNIHARGTSVKYEHLLEQLVVAREDEPIEGAGAVLHTFMMRGGPLVPNEAQPDPNNTPTPDLNYYWKLRRKLHDDKILNAQDAQLFRHLAQLQINEYNRRKRPDEVKRIRRELKYLCNRLKDKRRAHRRQKNTTTPINVDAAGGIIDPPRQIFP